MRGVGLRVGRLNALPQSFRLGTAMLAGDQDAYRVIIGQGVSGV